MLLILLTNKGKLFKMLSRCLYKGTNAVLYFLTKEVLVIELNLLNY